MEKEKRRIMFDPLPGNQTLNFLLAFLPTLSSFFPVSHSKSFALASALLLVPPLILKHQTRNFYPSLHSFPLQLPLARSPLCMQHLLQPRNPACTRELKSSGAGSCQQAKKPGCSQAREGETGVHRILREGGVQQGRAWGTPRLQDSRLYSSAPKAPVPAVPRAFPCRGPSRSLRPKISRIIGWRGAPESHPTHTTPLILLLHTASS